MFKAHCLGSFQTLRLDNPFLERSSWPVTLGNLNLIQTYRLHTAKNTNQESLCSSWIPTIDRDLLMERSRLGPKGSRLKAKESFILVVSGDNSPAVGEGSFCLNLINPSLLKMESLGKGTSLQSLLRLQGLFVLPHTAFQQELDYAAALHSELTQRQTTQAA